MISPLANILLLVSHWLNQYITKRGMLFQMNIMFGENKVPRQL